MIIVHVHLQISESEQLGKQIFHCNAIFVVSIITFFFLNLDVRMKMKKKNLRALVRRVTPRTNTGDNESCLVQKMILFHLYVFNMQLLTAYLIRTVTQPNAFCVRLDEII